MSTFAESNHEKMNYRKEHIIYTLMWIILYLSPVMSIYMRMSGNPHIEFSWKEIQHAWMFSTVWLVTFGIHNFLLVPLLIVKRRTWRYFVFCIALILADMSFLYVNRPSHFRKIEEQRRRAEMRADSIAYENIATVRLGNGRYCRPQNPIQRRPLELRPIDPLPMFGPGEWVAGFGALLLMGMNVGVKLYFKSSEDREAQQELEKRNLEQQMEYLKYQVNPHFFMNTLNNIHALVDIDPERAKTTIVELSKMMRYILYEGSNKLIPLSREVQFLDNYIQLMRMRYSNRVKINADLPRNMNDGMLPPLLLIIFVENSFKHGISYKSESFIDVSIAVGNGRMYFHCRNSKVPPQPAANAVRGGMGLQNVRQRLDLLFPGQYTLDISDGTGVYDVRLDIPLASMPMKEYTSQTQEKT